VSGSSRREKCKSGQQEVIDALLRKLENAQKEERAMARRCKGYTPAISTPRTCRRKTRDRLKDHMMEVEAGSLPSILWGREDPDPQFGHKGRQAKHEDTNSLRPVLGFDVSDSGAKHLNFPNKVPSQPSVFVNPTMTENSISWPPREAADVQDPSSCHDLRQTKHVDTNSLRPVLGFDVSDSGAKHLNSPNKVLSQPSVFVSPTMTENSISWPPREAADAQDPLFCHDLRQTKHVDTNSLRPVLGIDVSDSGAKRLNFPNKVLSQPSVFVNPTMTENSTSRQHREVIERPEQNLQPCHDGRHINNDDANSMRPILGLDFSATAANCLNFPNKFRPQPLVFGNPSKAENHKSRITCDATRGQAPQPCHESRQANHDDTNSLRPVLGLHLSDSGAEHFEFPNKVLPQPTAFGNHSKVIKPKSQPSEGAATTQLDSHSADFQDIQPIGSESRLYLSTPDFEAEGAEFYSQERLNTSQILQMPGVRILQLNCQSFKKHYGEVCREISRTQPLIICMQEIWRLDSAWQSKLRTDLPDYNVRGRKSRVDRDGGGVMTLVHKSLGAQEIETEHLKAGLIELCVTRVRFLDEVRIANVYVPPDVKIGREVWTRIVQSLGPSAILMGDLNAQHESWWPPENKRVDRGRQDRGAAIEEVMSECGWTGVGGLQKTHEKGSCIDLCFTNLTAAASSYVANAPIGGHYPLLQIFDMDADPVIRIARNLYKKAKRASYVQCATELLRDGIKGLGLKSTVDDVANMVRGVIFDASKMGNNIPRLDKTTKRSETTLHRCEWFEELDDEARYDVDELTKSRNEFFRANIDFNDPRAACRRIRLLFDDCGADAVYSGIRSPTELAEELAEKFNHRLSPEEAAEERQIALENLAWLTKHKDHAVIFTEEDARLSLNALEEEKAGGIDGVDTKQVAWLSEVPEFLAVVTLLANMIAKTGRLPSGWLTAVIRPIPKDDVEKEFRPISLLPVMCKVIQSMFEVKIYAEISEKISPRQFGSQKGVSASQAIAVLIDRALRLIGEGKKVCILSIDFEKAFDKVRRQVLVAKLIKAGVAPGLVRYVAGFVETRYATVEVRDKFDGHRSDTYDSVRGVVQGSCIGPTCFLLFIDELLRELEPMADLGVEAQGFVDDIMILISGDTTKELKERASAAARVVEQWSTKVGLPINRAKSKVLPLYKTKSNFEETISEGVIVGGVKAKTVRVMKILGILVDSRLRLTEYVDQLVARMASRMRVVNMLAAQQWGPSMRSVRALYRSYVESLPRYALTTWFARATKASIRRVEVIINSAARTVSGVYKTRNEVAFWLSNVPTLSELYELESQTEIDRALRVPRTGMGLYLMNERPSSILAKPLAQLRKRFPPEEFHRRELPALKSYAHLTREFSKIEIDVSSVESSDELGGCLQSIDIELYTDGGVSHPKEWTRKPNRSAGGWKGRTRGAQRHEWGGGFFFGCCNHSFGAERGAMTQALRELLPIVQRQIQKLQRVPRVLVATDSLSLLLALRSRQVKCAEDLDLLRELAKLATVSRIKMQHVRGHCGIAGNESADENATAAMRAGFTGDASTCSLLQEAAKADVKADARKLREKSLEEIGRENSLVKRATEMCGLKSVVKHMKTDLPIWVGRAWCQAVAGYCPRISGYRHPTNVHLDGKCQWCAEQCNDVIEHFFLECEKHEETRKLWRAELMEEKTHIMQMKVDANFANVGLPFSAPKVTADAIELDMKQVVRNPQAAMKYIRRALCDKRSKTGVPEN